MNARAVKDTPSERFLPEHEQKQDFEVAISEFLLVRKVVRK